MGSRSVNKDELLKDSYMNIAYSLPLSQVAKIHNCSKAYVSQVCKGYGLKLNKKKGTVTAPISILQKIFWER
jgi:hypothetical protein